MNKGLGGITPLAALVSAYRLAKDAVIKEGYDWEVWWQDSLTFSEITETDFLREAAWVILSCGMAEKVIRKKFDEVSKSFFNWESSERIVESRRRCRNAALRCFNNVRKIDAIIGVAVHIRKKGYESVQRSIEHQGIDYIMELPYMGPATSYHLAKNIGLPAVKPDRHLNRVAEVAGYSTAYELCANIASVSGEKISVVDLVIWRYATLNRDYLELFSPEFVMEEHCEAG